MKLLVITACLENENFLQKKVYLEMLAFTVLHMFGSREKKEK